jgi:hypothetical protein
MMTVLLLSGSAKGAGMVGNQAIFCGFRGRGIDVVSVNIGNIRG